MNFIASLLYAVSTAVLLATALCFALGGLNPAIAGLCLAAGAAVGAWAVWQGRHNATTWRRLNIWESATIVCFSLFGLRSFLWLVFLSGDNLKVLSPNNLGDFSLHLTYIRFLAAGAPFWPDNPIISGHSLTYPLGMDLFNAMLSLNGLNDLRAMVWVGLAGCAAAGIALWRWGGPFTMMGFLANGGTAGWAILREGKWADYQSGMAWKSIALALFVTQRGLLFALPAGLLLMASWQARFFPDERGRKPLPFWGELLLYASLPIFHLHTFLFLSVLLAAWWVSAPATRHPIAVLVGSAFVPASALVMLVTGFFRGPSVLGWKPGWMQGSEPFLTFWWNNFGVLPLFALALVFVLWRRPAPAGTRALAGTALGVFLTCCFVKFAPWEWDNTKLMIWSYLAILPLLWSHLISRWPVPLRALACVGLFFSGFVSTFGGLDRSHTGYPIADRLELDGMANVMRALPVTERFIGWPTYNHPVLLSGRKMAMGYTGHVWSHGLDWRDTSEQVNQVLSGDLLWRRICNQLEVRYLFWGAMEEENFPASSKPWRIHSRLVAKGPWGAIYDLNSPPDPPQPAPEAAAQ